MNAKNSELVNESVRKGIHVLSSAIPFSYIFIPREIEIILLSVFFAVMVLVDLGRVYHDSFGGLYDRLLGNILRQHEDSSKGLRFTGGTYIVLGFLLSVILFPKPLAITSMFIVIFCDTLAALVGKTMGKTVLRKGKTLQGSLAFLITGAFIIALSPKMTEFHTQELAAGFSALVITTVVEVFPVRVDDNVMIPLVFGFTYLFILKLLI